MEMAKSLRIELNLSQQQLSLLLNVAKSTLSMAELGKRMLPLAAMEKLANMQQLLQHTHENRLAQKTLPPAHKNKAVHQKLIKGLHAKARKAELNARPIANKLLAMQENYEQCLGLLQIVQAAQAKAAVEPIRKAELDLMEAGLLLKIYRCGPMAQAPLKYKLSIWNHHQQAAKEIIEDLSDA